MAEDWRPVVGWEDLYEVSDEGRVRNLRTGHLLAFQRLPKGYLTVELRQRGRPRYRRLVHRLVLFAFVGPCPDGHECNHQDGDKTNNHLGNLEWTTPSANQLHSYRTGLHPVTRGERVGLAKLTEGQVRTIRTWRGRATLQAVAEQFGVGQTTIFNIWHGQTWGWLT